MPGGVGGRREQSRLLPDIDIVSTMPSASFRTCAPPQRRFNALATNAGAICGLVLLGLANTAAADFPGDGGHLKAQLGWIDSANPLRRPEQRGADLRLKFSPDMGAWAAELDYQLSGQSADRFEWTPGAAGLSPGAAVQEDSRRLMKLSANLAEGKDYRVAHRLDRLSLAWRGEQWVGRVGRQALSWGNGLIYNPVDIFNPFDPTAVDREYKPGDDMVYGQYLRRNGDDLQVVWAPRREQRRRKRGEVNSLAVKYHGFAVAAEYDLLLARHYDQWMAAAGGSAPLGDALLRADLALTDSGNDPVISLMTGLSWSWIGLGKNISAVLEYYRNGFGLREGFELEDLQRRPELGARLARGELFTLGRHYLAGSMMVEVSPLFQLTSNLFTNLADHSRLVQLVASYDLRQNWRILLAAGFPSGGGGTEYGGLGSDGHYPHQGPSCFGQLAFYF